MRRGLAVSLVVVCLATVASIAPVGASHAPRGFCSETGDFCISAKKVDGVRHLGLGTFAHRGEFRLCVTGAHGKRVCKRFRLADADNDGFFAKTVNWRNNYPLDGYGDYWVRWWKNGRPLGPRLGFHWFGPHQN